MVVIWLQRNILKNYNHPGVDSEKYSYARNNHMADFLLNEICFIYDKINRSNILSEEMLKKKAYFNSVNTIYHDEPEKQEWLLWMKIFL